MLTSFTSDSNATAAISPSWRSDETSLRAPNITLKTDRIRASNRPVGTINSESIVRDMRCFRSSVR